MDEPRQDLHLAELHLPDPNWQAAVAIVPSQHRLSQPHCVVDVTNTSPAVKHTLIDRHQQPIDLEPGQTRRGIEMLVSEVEHFRSLRAPGRMDRTGRILPPHPLKFDVPEVEAEAPIKRKN